MSSTTEARKTTERLLTVEGLSVHYIKGGEKIPAVNEVSFTLDRGERLAIIGESGSGKSTITQALLGVLPTNAHLEAAAGDLGGTRIFSGLSEKEWSTLRRGRIAYVPQDPNISLNPVVKVGKQLIEAIGLNEPQVEKAGREPRAKALLGIVGIEDVERVFHAFPHQVSGGQRQRILIAIALVGDPELIVADEPTSGLDVAVQQVILDLFDEIALTTRAAIILITHDLAVAANRADRVVVLERGRIVEQGTASQVTSSPSTAYSKALIAAVPSLSRAKLEPSAPTAQSGASTRLPLRGDVRVEGVEKTYITRDSRRGRTLTHAARGVTFEIAPGTTYGLVGQSGSGKSTIARIVAGIDKPDKGDVLLDGRHLAKGSRTERRTVSGAIQYVFQNPYSSLDPKQTIRQIIAEPLEGRQSIRGKEAESRIAEVLDAVGLPAATIGRRPTELSGGQRQRVAIARGIVTRPELLVLDEPVSALDVSVQAQVLQLLIDLQHEFGTSYLFISHDLAVISEVSDRVGVLHQGILLEEGTAAEIFDTPKHDYTRNLLAAIPTLTSLH